MNGGNRWTRDEQGNKIHLNLSDYGIEGERESVWFVSWYKHVDVKANVNVQS